MAKLIMDHGARWEAEAATKLTLLALGMLGLVTASTAITLAVSDPPAWLGCDAYALAVSGVFFTGTTELSAAVWVLSTSRNSVWATKMLVYGAALLVSAVAASLLW